jgi:hypothetical protein
MVLHVATVLPMNGLLNVAATLPILYLFFIIFYKVKAGCVGSGSYSFGTTNPLSSFYII